MGVSNKKRVHLIDELRGILIIYVVLYHLTYDLSEIFLMDFDWMYSSWMNTIRNTMTGCLIVIAGISCTFSSSNMKRGLKILGIGFSFTVFTYLFMPDQLILFGILHFFGVSILIYAFLERLLSKIPIFVGMIGSFYLYFFSFHLYEGYIGLFTRIAIKLPDELKNYGFFYPLGFPVEGMSSADYYPIIPWIFLLIAGSFIGRYLKKENLPKFLYKTHSKKLSFLGRHTLVIYLIHQPIIYGVLYILLELL